MLKWWHIKLSERNEFIPIKHTKESIEWYKALKAGIIDCQPYNYTINLNTFKARLVAHSQKQTKKYRLFLSILANNNNERKRRTKKN